MNAPEHTARRVVIVGGGVSGLSTAVCLAHAGLPVTLLEASRLGHAASTRNQGWLHSGGLYVRQSQELARLCRRSLEHTLRFCPDCLEPQQEGMYYLISRPDTLAADWTSAWDEAGISWQEADLDRLIAGLPLLDRTAVQHAFLLPDRAIRVDTLLLRLAAVAENAAAEIRTETRVSRILHEEGVVTGVETATGEQIAAGVVVLAGGAEGLDIRGDLAAGEAGAQEESTLVALKTHLVALTPEVGRLPFCVIDEGGFNHVPHPPTSVFGSDVWTPVADAHDQHPDQAQLDRIWQQIARFFPSLDRAQYEVLEWAGTTIQAMRVEQVTPGEAPLPAVIDHGAESPAIENFVSIFPGRTTLWDHVAEEACRMVLNKMAHDQPPASTAPPWAGG